MEDGSAKGFGLNGDGQCSIPDLSATSADSCPEGWEKDAFDFYTLDAAYVRLKTGYECRSTDSSMGPKSSIEECVDAVRKSGGRFMIYGTGSKAGDCYEMPWSVTKKLFIYRPEVPQPGTVAHVRHLS